jgi:hypothetical protein
MERGSGAAAALRYLDGEAERLALIEDIRSVRQTVIDFAQDIPQERWYEPRFHGWTLAAMLSHLHNADNVALMQMKLALLGIHLTVSAAMLNRINDAAARFFRARIVPTTIKDIRKNEKRIADFILYLPMDRFTREVHYPPTGEMMTIERAVQQYFLFHWRDHLRTLQGGEGVSYEPPTPDIDMV